MIQTSELCSCKVNFWCIHVYTFLNRHCLAYVYGLLLKTSLNDFKTWWNCHCIRQTRLSDYLFASHNYRVHWKLYDLCKIAATIFILSLLYYTCTISYAHSIDFLVWSHFYLEYTYKAPPLYPAEFEVAATAILAQLNMTCQDICQ